MRPEILFPLFTSVSTLKGVGPRVAPLVEKLAGPIVRDVLFTAPTGLIRRGLTTVDQAVEGQVQTFVVTIDAHQPPHGAVAESARSEDRGRVTARAKQSESRAQRGRAGASPRRP